MSAAIGRVGEVGRPPPPPGTVTLMGVRLDALTVEGAAERVCASLGARVGGWVITPNLDILRRLVRDQEFADLCAPATMRLADGMPLVWAARLRGTPLPGRAAGSDLIWPLCRRAAREGRSVFLLGGNPGTAEAAAARLRGECPGLPIAGTECPPLGFEHDLRYVEDLLDRVAAARPDIVLVALGSPKQERLISRLRERLPGAWLLGIGVTFSFVTGEIRRAPAWMRRIGLEWVHRLAQEPGRLARRYLVDGVPFAARLLAWAVGQRLWWGRAGARGPDVPVGTGTPPHCGSESGEKC
ncbi:MAG TPA: WecB/TagA/CpsF family glycosyltransferase [Phycisphaerales bacterium]|nr:WecB/TagA/CpsF family glycosyltransferase [Phycisphaerales bacterium]